MNYLKSKLNKINLKSQMGQTNDIVTLTYMLCLFQKKRQKPLILCKKISNIQSNIL